MRTSRQTCSLPQILCLAAIHALSGCSVPAGKMGEASTLHAGEVVQVLTRTDILGSRGIHESLTNSGVPDSAITDGSVVIVRTLCCGPPNTSNPHGALNPNGLPIHVGDAVEFLWPGGSAVNTVTRVLQPAGQSDGACWWDPRDDKLWRRVMFCNWMPQQGWVKQEGQMVIGWYKPAGHP
jgi:hypothetical protein